jgi:DNA ligase (NAD+)
LHNADIIEGLDLKLGDWVYVEKGGEIIPKIVGVDNTKRDPFMEAISFPKYCPICKTELVRKEGESANYCPNEKSCPPQIKGKLEHFISRKAMNIDSLGEGKIEILFDNMLVGSPADLYKLNSDNILGIEKIYQNEEGKTKKLSFKEKTVQNILNGISNSKSVPFARVLFALGIRYVGETIAKKLAKHFKDIDALKIATFEELVEAEEIGEKIAESLILWFKDDYNLELISELKAAGLQFEIVESNETTSDILKGKSIVVSGTFKIHSRKEIESFVEVNGAKLVDSVSKKTDFIVAGDKMGPSKLEKAKNLGIKIISEDEFLEIISVK